MKAARQIHLKTIGDVYLPAQFADAADAPLKLFGPEELDQLNRIFSLLRRGGVAVVSGQWSKILEVFSYLEKKKREFATGSSLRTREERRSPAYRTRINRWYERHYQSVLSRVMVIASDDRLTYIEPPIYIPYLFELLGEPTGANAGRLLLVPVSAIQKIQSDMERSYYISSLDGDIVTHGNVLPPLSQDTIELFLEALQKVRQTASLPTKIEILDMGCGCGCLSLLAAKAFADRDVKITATDILPEAVATTRINLDRLVVYPAVIETTDSGDLFEPVGDRCFDLIIFNVPWVVSRPRSRAEIAICDEDQGTVRRFLTGSPHHLNERGHIVLGYSDHSGPKVLETLEGFISDAGFGIENVFKKRIQSRRQKRKWETILVYDLIKHV